MKKRSHTVQGIAIFCFLVLLLGAGVQSLQAEVTASATLNVHSFPMDRAATLSLTVNGVRS